MTNREKKKSLDILYGKSSGIVVSLIMTATLMLLVLIFVLWLVVGGKLGLQDSVGVMLAEVVILGLFLGVFAIIIDLIVGYYVHCNILKHEFENLWEWKKEKLLVLAHNYGSRKGIYVADDYIYGLMTEQRHGRKRGVYTLTFRYIEFSEVIWAYKIERHIAVTNANPTIITTPKVVPYEKKLRLYTRDGRYFEGKCSEMENQKLFDMLREKNPSCKLGYKKEWKKWLKDEYR